MAAAAAAARLLRRRLAAAISESPAPSSRGFSFPPPSAAGLRSLLTVTEASCTAAEERSAEQCGDAPAPTPQQPSFKVRDTSNLKISPRHDLTMIFTCKVCDTRSMKMASRDSYENGVVVVRCAGCNNLHLIADRLGWFGEPGSIEDFLAAKGEEVKKGSMDALNFSLDELAGSGSQLSSKGPSEQN
ncbi:hypothetical protein BS78_04G322300 [Paspalum vaginatum]|nr:hypothetical protein BS78_04G322300 [Paspalum vaginatum]